MATKVNLKKYVSYEGKWQFFPVLKTDGKPRPEAVLVRGEPIKLKGGTFYLDYRQDGKRVQKPCGTSPREALDAWRFQVAQLDGIIDADDDGNSEPSVAHDTIENAISVYLAEVKATKSPGTLDAYRSDLDWFKSRLSKRHVGQVKRADLIRLFGIGNDEKLSAKSTKRRVLVGLMALRNAGAQLKLKKGDWPVVKDVGVEVYEPEQIKAFFAACDETERLLFQTFLCSGFRMAEIGTLTWPDIDWKHNTLRVKAKPEYNFKPKNHEERTVRVPAALIEGLKKRQKTSTSALVFPTAPHPNVPNTEAMG